MCTECLAATVYDNDYYTTRLLHKFKDCITVGWIGFWHKKGWSGKNNCHA